MVGALFSGLFLGVYLETFLLCKPICTCNVMQCVFVFWGVTQVWG